MPKKQPRNAFYYFMLEFQKREKSNGRVFDGLKDVQSDPQCTQEWTNMTKEEKAIYESMANDAKLRDKEGKLTGTGESIDLLRLEKKKVEEFNSKMLEFVTATVNQALKNNVLHLKKFYVIHVNYFYAREAGLNVVDYAPAEFAVVRFSLKNGIEDVYHKILYCKPVLGYTRKAFDHSKMTHQIPCEHQPGEKDFSRIYDELMQFVDGCKIKTPLFTMNNGIDVVRSFLNRLVEATKKNLDQMPVYSLELLFSRLRSASSEITIPVALAESDLLKDPFSHTTGIECEYHKQLDGATQNCSMSIAKRWIYTISDFCCEPMNIRMLQGVHYPFVRSVDTMAEMFNKSLSTFTIASQTGKSTSMSSVTAPMSMTGVAHDYRDKVSMRTAAEEKRRRTESAPIKIVSNTQSELSDFSDKESVQNSDMAKSFIESKQSSDFDISCSESEFPTLGGRGMLIKKNKALLMGRGHGSPRT